jgi:tetratricopeptide (TPR) repeat protein
VNACWPTAAGGWITALPLLLAVLLAAGGCGSAPDAEDLYARATHAAAARNPDFEEAVALTRKCLELNPDHVQALVLHGYCRYQLMTPEGMARDSSPVITYVEKAARLAPDDFAAQYFHGWMLFEAEEFGRALEPLERALRLKDKCPEHEADVLVMLSMCCVNRNLGRGRTYLQALRRFQGFERSPLLYNALGVLYAKQRDYQEALSAFREGLRRDPKNAVILQNLAVLYDERFRIPEEAMRYYREAKRARQDMRDTSRQGELASRLRQLAADRLQPAGGRK